ncbi:hypothetical protein [Sinisalibacter lacisalsi]|uniref:Lipoprotein n=1 Tax=Sinisalibacter lacisalsi TaxID=1526570 RepID=A0ABQ1QDV8_9RHOB|nr:hypothetical protein [Sinisalibacter lacisalsi]GGD24134.1 hypothetical protein GCM10011358_05730 [Sinisalibacter lacisalsi]
MTRLKSIAARATALVLSAGLLSACAVTDLGDTPEPLGRFLLGHNVAVVSKDVEILQISRKIENDVWVDLVRDEMNTRFSRYDGDEYYHISTAILGYILAPPGIPVVAAPKSILMADVYLFRDSDGGKPLTDEPKRFTVFEEGGDALIGSGLTRTAEEQARSLARSLAKQVQNWMLENKEWFGDASLMDPATTSPGRPVQPLEPQSRPATEG